MSSQQQLAAIKNAVDTQGRPAWAIDETEHYWLTDNTIWCCGDHASVYQCKVCEEVVECEFHNDLSTPHCEPDNEA